jgi:uncharacterized RDD family membrane protein YckC
MNLYLLIAVIVLWFPLVAFVFNYYKVTIPDVDGLYLFLISLFLHFMLITILCNVFGSYGEKFGKYICYLNCAD